jgi:hypothetical protein
MWQEAQLLGQARRNVHRRKERRQKARRIFGSSLDLATRFRKAKTRALSGADFAHQRARPARIPVPLLVALPASLFLV